MTNRTGETSNDAWGVETAERYDAELGEMGNAAVLDPTLDFLTELAGSGRALEFAIGTGRVGLGLARRGVDVAGIEYSSHMLGQLRAKADAEELPVVAHPFEVSQDHLGFDTYDTVDQTMTSHHFRPDGENYRRFSLTSATPGQPSWT